MNPEDLSNAVDSMHDFREKYSGPPRALPPVAGSRKKSPADICLTKKTTWVNFRRSDILRIDKNLGQIAVTIEHRAWVCPWCGNSTEYWLVNGMCVIGCGKSTMMWMGRESDCCDSPICRSKQEKWHSENPD